ncbi:hypothetical protein Gotur_017157, partial [Gossypium turneri]
TECVLNILSGCPHLEHLDIEGCLEVELDHLFLKDKFPKLKNLLGLRLRNDGGPWKKIKASFDAGTNYLLMYWADLHQPVVTRVIDSHSPCLQILDAGSLQVLRLSGSLISDSIVKQTAQRLSTLTFLDLTCCPKIGAQALEAIGKYCKLLETLCRDIMFLDVLGKVEAEDEANAIAGTMPRLKHLDLGFHLISTECVLNILSRCHQLERLIINVCVRECDT